MTYTKVSSCPRCGATIYVPTILGSVLPASNIYTCNCRNMKLINYDGTTKEVDEVEVKN